MGSLRSNYMACVVQRNAIDHGLSILAEGRADSTIWNALLLQPNANPEAIEPDVVVSGTLAAIEVA